MILSAVDFPEPLAPRMIFVCPLMSVKLRSRRTTLSSKASCTRSNTTTGAPTSASTCFAVRPLAVAFMSAGIDREYEDLRDEEVCRDDCDGSGDDRQRRRLADTLRAAARPQPDASHQHQSGQHRAQLLDHRRAHETSHDRTRAELIERQAALRRERHTGEQPGHQYDRQRSNADQIELLDDIVAVNRTGEDAAEGGGGQKDVFLNFERRFLEPGVDGADHAALGPR